jgi:hypothetical protein
MESNHHSTRHRVYSAGSSPLLSVRKKKGDRPDSNRYFEVHNLGCWPLHHSHHATSGGDRTRTGDFSPDKRALSPLSYAPKR